MCIRDRAQAVGERPARDGGLNEEVLHARHALSRGEDLAGRAGGMRGVDHRTGLGGHGGKMVEDEMCIRDRSNAFALFLYLRERS